MSIQRLTKVIPLGAGGLDYIKEHLTGVNTLCTALLELVEAAPGEVFTLAPVEATRERMLKFSEGYLLASNSDSSRAIQLEEGGVLMPVDSLVAEQAKWLYGLMQASTDVCIVDDFNPSWDDLRDRVENAFGYEDQAYRLLSRADNEEALVEALKQSNYLWHGVACVTAYAPELDVDRVVEFDELREAAHNAHAITCTAYDGEGFVAWRRM